MSEASRRAWEERTERPLVVAAACFLIAYAWPILDTSLPEWAVTALSLATYGIWIMFAVDYGIRLVLTEHRWHFVRCNWIDLVILGVPMLRPLRPLRAVLAFDLLARRSGFVRSKVVAYIGAAVAVLLFIAALAVLEAERPNPEATIRSFGDALWWAATTVTTVGYGDRFPMTGEGRVVAVGLMLTGIALVGVVTAALASWFIERVSAAASAERQTDKDAVSLAAEVRVLRAELEAVREEIRSPLVGEHRVRTDRG